ncbi:flippase [Clostridium butyricum]|uniref:flippase n=1 Tax=Clostridium butyricum TaxID=1492 RepID=UPI00071E9E4D|nr:flippase [Clostridium butyricum]ALS18153.1 hypothetical protein ATD26_15050 [Clostridium butyricum]MDM8132258.1 flippase [Clostridium butyricum]MDM8230705.1 flippase [Clostridium butyricum]
MESIRKNYAFQIAYQILNMCIPFITSPYISRVLGAENLGIYSYTYSIANIFIIFINLGIEKYGSRTIAMVKSDRQKLNYVFSELLFIRIILGTITILLYAIGILMFFDYKEYFVIQGLLLVGAVIDINWFFFGIEKFKITVTRNFLLKICTVCCIFIFVKNKEDLWKYIVVIALGTVISQSAIWIVVKNYVSIVKIKKTDLIPHIKPILILFIAVLAQSAYTYIDKIMIGTLGNMEQLGFCDNAYKIISFPMGVITSLGVVMLPRMSMLYTLNKNEQASYYIKESMKIVMIIACGIVAGMVAVGKDFSIIFWGENFETSGIVVSIISPIVFFMSWSDVIRNQYLIPKKYDKKYTIAIVIGAIVNIILNMLFIPFYGAIGAAIGTVVSYFSIAVYQTFATRKELPYLSFIKDIVPFFIFSIIMITCVQLTKNILGTVTIVGLLIQIIVGILVYGILVLIYMILKKDAFIMDFFVKKNKSL